MRPLPLMTRHPQPIEPRIGVQIAVRFDFCRTLTHPLTDCLRLHLICFASLAHNTQTQTQTRCNKCVYTPHPHKPCANFTHQQTPHQQTKPQTTPAAAQKPAPSAPAAPPSVQPRPPTAHRNDGSSSLAPPKQRPKQKVLHDGELPQHLCLVHLDHPAVHLGPGGHTADVIEHRGGLKEGALLDLWGRGLGVGVLGWVLGWASGGFWVGFWLVGALCWVGWGEDWVGWVGFSSRR